MRSRKRPEIEGAILFYPSYNREPGKRILNVETQGGVALVIPKDDVVSRPVALDQI
jgi:hypothetical protein